MAKSKKIDNTSEVIVEEEKTKKESSLYFFYTQGCGWCKKVIPIIDELVDEGYDILKLDLADGENGKLQTEIKNEYKHQCGTPYFVDAESGNTICGYREKDIIEKWANGEEIPAPPRPKSQPPRPPFQGVSKKEESKWKKEYKKWANENSHLPKIQTAEEILERPRPKTEPPKPPNPQGTDAELEAWGKGYDKWKNENSHLPNLQPVETILQRFKQQRDAQGQTGKPPVQNTQVQNQVLETKISKLEKRINELENKKIIKIFQINQIN